MIDRLVQYPNRFKLVPVEGTTDTFDLIPVPGVVTQEGTTINKANLLSDPVGAKYGLDSDGTPDGAFQNIVREFSCLVPLSGWSNSTTNGFYTNQVTVSEMKQVYTPIWFLGDHSSSTIEESRDAFSAIVDMITYDGYVVFRAIEKPESDVYIGIKGV